MLKKVIYASLLLVFFYGCFLFKKSFDVPQQLLGPDVQWTMNALQQMSLDKKIGQMIMVVNTRPIYNESDPEFIRLKDIIRRYSIGGIIFNHGDSFQRAMFLNRLQKTATKQDSDSDQELTDIPLFFAADFERGVGQRFDGGTTFLPAMAIAATGDPQNSYKSGEITAREARALGFHLIFAPVADVNNNPLNPIINTRSFGDNPEMVARYATAFINGVQEHGMLATAKHFPGHGNTSIDSHIDLPSIKGNFSDLQKSELVPFIDAIKNDVAAIMTAHIYFPEYDNEYRRPATLSPLILNDLLRQRLQFNGLIITDAFAMGAIQKNYYEGDAVVSAINAGVDMILVPASLQVAFISIREAIQDKKLSIQRIDESVKKILLLKSRLGLHKQPFVDTDRLMYTLRNPQSLAIAGNIARQAITLVNNKDLPLSFNKNSTFYVLAHHMRPGFQIKESVFLATLSSYYPYPLFDQLNPYQQIPNQQKILANATTADYLVNVFYLNETIGFPEEFLQLMSSIQKLNKPIFNIFLGSPYVSSKLPPLSHYIFAYSDQASAQQAAAEALIGKIGFSGKLPVSIPNIAASGEGIQLPPAQMKLVATDFRHTCPNPHYIDSLKTYLKAVIADSAFPGCAISVGYKGQLLLQEGFGNYIYDKRSKQVTSKSIYDLASVTKVVATTTMAMILHDRGQMQLDWKVRDIIPDFQGFNKENVTIRHLLTHTSGLPGWKRFYLELTGKERIVQEICDTDLIYQPGTKSVYSDLGMILTQRILETITQKSLDRLVKENLTDPLGMERTMYNPDQALLKEIVPTEFSDFHNILVRGFVHDENTYAMGGVSGHAGLFSTIEDLAVYCQMILNGGIYNYHRILWPETIERFTERQNLVDNSTRALGWDTRSQKGSMAGDYMSMNAFGHSGFTGTTIWMDPENQVFVVLLTNRVHPTRENQKIRQVRPVVHNYVMKAILEN